MSREPPISRIGSIREMEAERPRRYRKNATSALEIGYGFWLWVAAAFHRGRGGDQNHARRADSPFSYSTFAQAVAVGRLAALFPLDADDHQVLFVLRGSNCAAVATSPDLARLVFHRPGARTSRGSSPGLDGAVYRKRKPMKPCGML
jgi:hypothetical protein